MAGSHSLEMRNISKRFPGVVALDHVSLNVKSGTVHCIVGENGAGKSTLMKILSGLYVPDEGEILIDGEEVVIKSPVDALQKGISIIQQELAVAPELTVAQAVFLNREPMKFGGLIVDSRKMEEETQAILDRQNLPIRATQKMKELSIAQKQMIEIGKAVSFDAKVIIMDEPTSAISDREVEELFQTIRQNPKSEVEVNLPSQTVTNKATGRSETFEINGYKKHCLMQGLDDIDFLVQNQEKTDQWEQRNK